jgi:aldehyde oxidoreductase
VNGPGRSVGHESIKTRFTLNGETVIVDCPPTTRLGDVLRDELGQTGTKIGCDAGDCGACTVLLDGAQVCACLVAIAQVEDRSVETVEGLANGSMSSAARDAPAPALNRLQQAFQAHGAAQCGICTPGMLMAATDLLNRNPGPTENEVLDGLGGVLCRCTGYRKIVEAVLAATEGTVTLPPVPPRRAVGSRAAKADGTAKLTGREAFGADLFPRDSLWLRTVRSPYPSAAFRLGDMEGFRARHPGLVDVISAADVAENSFGIFPDIKDQPVLADGIVRFRGEAVLCLVGDLSTVLRIHDDDVPISWTPQPPVTGIPEGLQNTTQPIHAAHPDNVLVRGRVVRGDVDHAMQAAPFVAEAEFTTSHIEHAYIEPEAGYAERFRDPDGTDRIRIFSCTQTPYMDRDEIARILQIEPTQVRIVPSAVGGGFGGKLDIAIQPLLAVAAWKLNRPVRSVYTRPESMVSTTKRHPARMLARYACDPEGTLIAFDFSGDFDTGAYASWGNTVANRVPIHACGPYAVPNVRALTRAVYTNGPIGGAFRGFGTPQSTIAQEALLDDLAERVGLDRLEIRYRNALRAGDTTATGQVLTASVGLERCLDALRPRWKAALAECEAFDRDQEKLGRLHGKRRGVGIACMWYGIGNTVIPNPSTMHAGLRRDGRIMFYNGAVDIGQGSNTTLLQVLADAVGVPLDRIDYVMGDTDLTSDAGKTSASRQAFVSGKAAKLAGEALRQRMLELARADGDAVLDLDVGCLIARGRGGERRIPLGDLPVDARGDVVCGEGYFDPPTVPLDEDGQGVPYATYAFGAQVAEVEVDVELGTTRVLRVTAAHDVGRALNPTQVEGQIHGGVIQGLGMALMEEYIGGRTDNLHDYLIPTIGDAPPIDVILIEEPEPLGAWGAKGVGEPALLATAPAIFGAIRHATGVRVRHAPATPDRLRKALLDLEAEALNPMPVPVERRG